MGKLTTLTQDEQDNVIYDARTGDIDSLKAIFTDEVDPSVLPHIKDEYSLATPIHMAAANGHTEVIKYLLSLLSKDDAKALVNKRNESGNTALNWAAYNGHKETVEVLCDYGGDPFNKNNFRHDVFYDAQNPESDETENYLLKKFAQELDEEEDGEKAAFDEKDVKFTQGTELKKVEEGGEHETTEVSEPKEIEDLKQKTEQMKV